MREGGEEGGGTAPVAPTGCVLNCKGFKQNIDTVNKVNENPPVWRKGGNAV